MLLLSLLLACAPDISDKDDTTSDSASMGETGETGADTDSGADDTGRVRSADEGGGVTLVQVDASAEGEAVYFDFSATGESAADGGWELAFVRYDVTVNGGTTGDGGVEVAPVEETGFADLSTAPSDGWRTDTAEAAALGDWYDYDGATHTLSAADRVYVIRNGAGETWKLQFLDYYDDAGNSGFPSFRWAALGG